MQSSDVAKLVLGYLLEQGLTNTYAVFCKESPHLKDYHPNPNDMIRTQKLSLIVEEYFLLKGHDKNSRHDPETVLQFLWKQFDVLVGQLKHSTIHTVKQRSKAVRGITNQKVRVRELNRKNRASLQKNKTNSVFVPNPDIFKLHHARGASVSPQQAFVPPTEAPGNANGIQKNPELNFSSVNAVLDTSNCLPVQSLPKSNFQQVTKSGVFKGSRYMERVDGVANQSCTAVTGDQSLAADRLVSSGQLLSGEQFKSPKRKSVPPKKRSEELPSDDDLDFTRIVEKVLGQPAFSEKLAANINRAVEIDTASPQGDTTTGDTSAPSIAVVNSSKVEDILEMMKMDPTFDELFNSFADVDSDVLPPLASSPVRSSTKAEQGTSTSSLQTPKKEIVKPVGKTVAVFRSPFSSVVSSASTVPVVLSSDSTELHTSRAAEPTVSHVRHLDFSNMDEIPQASNSRAESTPVWSGSQQPPCGAFIGRISQGYSSTPYNDRISEITTGDWSNISSGKDVPEACTSGDIGISGEQSADSSGEWQGLEVNVKIEQNTRSFKNGTNSKSRNIVAYKDVSQCSPSADHVRVSGDNEQEEKEGEKENSSKSSEKLENCKNVSETVLDSRNEEDSLIVLEELATNAFAQRKQSMDESKAKDDGPPRNKENMKEKKGKTEEMLKKNDTKDERTSHGTIKTGKQSQTLNEFFNALLAKESRSKTINKGDDVSRTDGVTDDNPDTSLMMKISREHQEKGSKRKLEKSKRSSGSSKKQRSLPANLDVDKFLSSLIYQKDKIHDKE